MINQKRHLLSLLILLTAMIASSRADAQQRVRTARAKQKNRIAIVSPHSTRVIEGFSHKQVVTALKHDMLAAQNGHNGTLAAGYQTLVISLPNGASAKTLAKGNYGDGGDRAQKLKLKTGAPLEVTHLGTTSTHDFGSLGSGFQKALQQRIDGNTTFVRVNGKALVNGLKVDKSGISEHNFKLPLGKLTLDFSRGFGGREFGPSGYTMGRRLIIEHE